MMTYSINGLVKLLKEIDKREDIDMQIYGRPELNEQFELDTSIYATGDLVMFINGQIIVGANVLGRLLKYRKPKRVLNLPSWF